MVHSEGFLKVVEDARTRIHEITPEEAVRSFRSDSDSVLIDIREDHEWQGAHVEGAMHIGRGVIERDIERIIPDKERELLLYCGGGYRSALAADSLQRMGYTNVFSVAGGFKAIRALGVAIVSEE